MPEKSLKRNPKMYSWRTRITWILTTAIAAVALAWVPVASAQDDPSSAQYNPPIPDDTAGATASGSSSGLDSNLGSLPFTGLDVLIIVGVALLLTGTGFALRRLSSPSEPRS
ncbi:MAG: hypothetical protein FJW90_01760 [Actinobacteria bacterium]|nr:hypothetical protein [Actinomycetota bacterium]